jgi:D-alanine--D-alanine ligase
VLRDRVDVVFPCLHGRFGEDGVVQGLLEAVGIPYVGCGVLAAALAMDKERSKAVLRSATGVRTLASRVIRRDRWEQGAENLVRLLDEVELPVVVKPVNAGSSHGLSLVESAADLEPAIRRALGVAEAGGVMLEAYARGEEITCAVLGNPRSGLEALPPVLIRPHHGHLFDYASKYEVGGAEELCPAPVAPEVNRRVQERSLEVFEALGCRGLARIDFILGADEPWFLECNTMPGFTRGSLTPKSVQASGRDLPWFFSRLLELALEEHVSAPDGAVTAGRGAAGS